MDLFHLIWKPPLGERIVGIVQWRDAIVLVTDRAYYRVVNDGHNVQESREHLDDRNR